MLPRVLSATQHLPGKQRQGAAAGRPRREGDRRGANSCFKFFYLATMRNGSELRQAQFPDSDIALKRPG